MAGSIIILVERQVAKAGGDAQAQEGPLPAAPGLPRDDGSAYTLRGRSVVAKDRAGWMVDGGRR